MIRRAVCLFLLLAGAPLGAETVAGQAAKAADDLRAAIVALEKAEASRDRVAALTRTIRAYEEGLESLREALRQAQLRQATLAMRLESQRERIAQLLGVLGRIERSPGPLLLLHPSGPLGTARSGMMLADVTPALMAQADALKAELAEIAELRALQTASADTLARGLAAAQAARTALSKAISDRTDLPRRLAEDPEALRLLIETAETLESFAAGLALNTAAAGQTSFAAAMGRLPLPVMGRLIRRPDEPDAAGVRRPGMALATRTGALVTAPWPATIRYLGPLLDYGNVIVLEPGDGYLLVLAGLGTLYGEVGEVVAAGAPLGLMGGAEVAVGEPVPAGQDGTGAGDTETLYLELRLGATAVDPTEWFAATATTKD